MNRHPSYLDIPWNIHWQGKLFRQHHLWWLIAAITLMGTFLIGIGVTSGTL